MTASVIKIGNSRGLRLPKLVIEQCGFGDTVELTISGDRLVVSAPRSPRRGWAEAFREAGDKGRDTILLGRRGNRFDAEEWEW